MLWRIFFINTLLILYKPVKPQQCPKHCICYWKSSTIRCMHSKLRSVPKFPDDTRVVDLRYNKIQVISDNAFGNLAKLQTLYLNNNELKKIDERSLSGLKSLTVLYLNKNHISSLHVQAFNDLHSLRQLFLHGNRLKTLPKGLFNKTTRLVLTKLDRNPFTCNCDLIWLTHFLRTKIGYSQLSARCSKPSSLAHKSIATLDSVQFQCEKPRITQEPRDVEVIPGRSTYFICEAEGVPTPDIVWLHNGFEIDLSDEGFDILNVGTLIVHTHQLTNDGTYVCEARNNGGTARSRPAHLRFTGSRNTLQFLWRPNNLSAIEGETAEFRCGVPDDRSINMHWTRNGNRIQENSRVSVSDSGTLIISGVRHSDRGLYRCSATDNVETISASARLSINVPPKITGSPAQISIMQDEPVDLNCVVDGNPLPTITWTFDGTTVLSGGKYQISKHGQVLKIDSVSLADEGKYICHARNPVGFQKHSMQLKVTSRVAPTFKNTQPTKNVKLGSKLELLCEAEADPSPHYRWLHDGVPLVSRDTVQVADNRVMVVSADKSHEGVYECIASNVVGSSRSSQVVWVTEETPSPERYKVLQNAFNRVTQNVDRAINRTRNHLFNQSHTHTVEDLLQFVRYPSPRVVQLARAAEVFEETLNLMLDHIHAGNRYKTDNEVHASFKDLVSPAILSMLANMSGCLPHQRVIDCSDMCFYKKYRSMDGICNNLGHPTWGSANSEFRRLLKPQYENGLNTPRGWEKGRLYNGFALPSARHVSLELMSSDTITDDQTHTHMLMQWGQFIDHDMTLAPQSVSNSRFSDGRFCNETCDNHSPCFPIPVPSGDVRLVGRQCLGMTRTSSTCRSGTTSVMFNTLTARQQINEITSFIDASHVYGSSLKDSIQLRELRNRRGFLRVSYHSAVQKPLMPFDVEGITDCEIDRNSAKTPCFLAGDRRANEQLGLLAMHTLWVREHNRIAVELLHLNSHWDYDRLYHEARKIIGAIMQHITYTHWLPEIFGPIGMDKLGVYNGYNPAIDPSMSNAFATAAMRFGHGIVKPIIHRLNASMLPIPQGNLPLHKAFFAPNRLISEGGVDPLLRGLFGMASKQKKINEMFNGELTEKLFSQANDIGQDLAALNIQRGRDHGLPSYNDYREYCGLPRYRDFAHLKRNIRNRSITRKLRSLYGHVDNIDLFLGGMLEPLVHGSLLGETFLCIMVDQFKATRDGDRMWHENEGVFTRNQVMQIKQTTLAGVICSSGDAIDLVQTNVFRRVPSSKGYTSCDSIEKLNLKLWKECCEGCGRV